MPNQRVIVIINPASGSSDEGFREKIEKALKKSGVDYEIRETTKERDGSVLAAEARKEGAEKVIACGGDGTVMAVVNGLGANENDKNVALGIVPGGTANLVAAALEIPTDTEEAVEVALNGKERDVDLGKRDDTLFVLGVGVGLTERLVSQASSEAKEKIGRFAYVFAMLKELGAKPQEFEFSLDGGASQKSKGVAVVVANSGDFGKGLQFAPNAKIDDGLLDLCILHRFGTLDVLRICGRALLGSLEQDRELSFHQARKIELKANPPLDVQIDGEPVDAKTPVIAEILPKALRVLVSASK